MDQSPKFKGYVLIVAMDEGRGFVLLGKKQRPEWQAGKFNFPGGRIEGSEHPVRSASRELCEETGLKVKEEKLDHFLTLKCLDQRRVFCYRVVIDQETLFKSKSSGDEVFSPRGIDAVLGDDFKPELVPYTSMIMRLALEENLETPVYIRVED